MPKYLVQASYSPEGAEGLLKDGGRKRRAAVETAVTAPAFSIATNASGAVALTTTPLLSPAEIDEATKKTVNCPLLGE